MRHQSGIHYLFSGFKLIRQSGLKRFVILPFLINFSLFTGLFFVFFHYVEKFNSWVNHMLPAWLHWLSMIIWLLFLLSFAVSLIYTFMSIANVIAAPFNSLLAEKVEEYLTGQSVPSFTLYENFKNTPRLIARQCSILVYYVPRAVLLLILFFIPFIQMIAPLLWFLFNAWFLTINCIDYAFEQHHLSFAVMRLWLKKRRGPALSFGIATFAATAIPILNFIAMPAAIAGATQFYIENKD
jgi:CysZ protein